MNIPNYPEWYFPTNKMIRALYFAECGPLYEEKCEWKQKFNEDVLESLKSYILLCENFPEIHPLTPTNITEVEELLQSEDLDIRHFLNVNEPIFAM